MSIRAFCRRQSLAESAFHFWRRELRLRESAQETAVTSSPTFVPVTVIAPATVAVEVRGPSGHVVTLAACDASSLKSLLAALAVGASC